MALSNKSLLQAKQVLSDIFHSNISQIVTRAALDKRIELVKFPYLQRSHDRYQKNRTLYTSQQYDPIRYWLIKNKFLTQEYKGGKYIYTVNRQTIQDYFTPNLVNDKPLEKIKTEKQKVMTKKEKVFRHIEDNGNAMRYTDIIKFAYELSNGIGSFDKKENRGYYACAFTYYSYWHAMFGGKRKKNINSPKGHFVIPTKNGHLKKLPNGLWTVVRPDGWKRKDSIVENAHSRQAIPAEEYESMCNGLKTYNISADQFDSLATDYYHKKDGDVESCYRWAYYDLLVKAGAISDNTKELKKEIDNIADEIAISNKTSNAEQRYAVVSEYSIFEGVFTEKELGNYLEDKDVNKYQIFEAGKPVIIEKKITTTITIKK